MLACQFYRVYIPNKVPPAKTKVFYLRIQKVTFGLNIPHLFVLPATVPVVQVIFEFLLKLTFVLLVITDGLALLLLLYHAKQRIKSVTSLGSELI